MDVVLCDPLGRSTQIEDYLGAVSALTHARVLVFTWSSSPSSVRRALTAGARGLLSKTVSVAELSTREAQVHDLICRGLSNVEIAEQLFVIINSVKTYVRQIYQKIGSTRRAQAVAWGLAHGY